MEDSRMPPFSESAAASRKKKASTSKLPLNHAFPPFPFRTGKKASRRNQVPNEVCQASRRNQVPNEVCHLPHPREISNSDSLPDLSPSGNEYRALRRKYLLLEEESFGLEKELKEMESEVKALEGEKVTLLDQLVVLEGLVDSSDSHLQVP